MTWKLRAVLSISHTRTPYKRVSSPLIYWWVIDNLQRYATIILLYTYRNTLTGLLTEEHLAYISYIIHVFIIPVLANCGDYVCDTAN